MRIYLGKTGLKETYQEKFPEIVKCNKCKSESRIMFVGIEKGKEKQWICNLHENQKDGKYWVHDAIAYAVYLCSRCFEPNIRLNHA